MEGEWASFHVTQMLADHDCFGHYQSRIGSEATHKCYQCGADRDTAQHTLEDCSAWVDERCVLVVKIGADFKPRAVIKAPVREGEESWRALSSCNTVMWQKEKAERERIRRGERPQRGVLCPPRRRKAQGHWVHRRSTGSEGPREGGEREKQRRCHLHMVVKYRPRRCGA